MHHAYAIFLGIARGMDFGIFAVYIDFTPVRPLQTAEYIHQCALSRSVLPKKS